MDLFEVTADLEKEETALKAKWKAAPLPAKLAAAMAALVFLAMLALNCLTPYVADDYTFSFSYATGERLTGLWDVLQSQWYHYFHWSGRFIIKCLAQFFTVLPKGVFDLLNAAVYAGLGLVLHRLAQGQRQRFAPVVLALIYLSLWMVSPVFGQTNLWMCGSFNYLWATFFCTAALLPYALHFHRPLSPRRWLAPACLLGGLVAGWASENTSAGLLVALVLCVGFFLWRDRKAPLWAWLGLLGALAGFALLILAPGNYQRQDAAADPRGPLTILAVRFLTALDKLVSGGGLVLLVLFAALFCLLALQKPKASGLLWPLALFAAALGANFAMILSPVYYDRSTHGVFTFLTAACAACAVQLEGREVRRVLAAGAAGLTMAAAVQFVWAGYDIASFFAMKQTRASELAARAAACEAEVVTYAIEPYTRWCSGWGLPDLRQDPDDWVCADTAKYYGLDSLCADEARTYPFPGKTNTAFETGEIPDI